MTWYTDSLFSLAMYSTYEVWNNSRIIIIMAIEINKLQLEQDWNSHTNKKHTVLDGSMEILTAKSAIPY